MSVYNVHEQVINYEIFVNGNRCIGTANVELPELTYKTQTVSGAGVAGEYEAPTLGQLESLELKLTFRALYEYPIALMQQTAVILSCRGAVQLYDAGNGTLKPLPVRVDARGRIKSGSLGKLEPTEMMETEITFECDVLAVYINNAEYFMIDKLNFVNRVNGTDFLASVRYALGI